MSYFHHANDYWTMKGTGDCDGVEMVEPPPKQQGSVSRMPGARKDQAAEEEERQARRCTTMVQRASEAELYSCKAA